MLADPKLTFAEKIGLVQERSQRMSVKGLLF